MFSVKAVGSTGTSSRSVRGKERVASIRWLSDRLPPLASPAKAKDEKEQVKEKTEERRKAKRTPGKEKDTIPTRESNAIIAGDGTT